MSLKPLMFGDAAMDAQRVDAANEIYENWDHSYVQGYSEQRRENEKRVAKGLDPVPMDRLQWVRVSKVNGQDTDMRDRGIFMRLGYQFVMGEPDEQTCQHLMRLGWGADRTGVPHTAYVAPDGTIRREDSALAIVDYEQAQKNLDRKNSLNAAAAGHSYTPREAAAGGIFTDESTEHRGIPQEVFDDLPNN